MANNNEIPMIENILTRSKKINLGCGLDKREGYLNVDLSGSHNPDYVCDVLKLDALPKNYYQEIIAQDILEHLPRCSTKRALLHWATLLEIGGKLILRVPNIIAISNLLQTPNNQSIKRHEEIIRDLFGNQAYTGDFHYTTFTELILESYLTECGFSIDKIVEADGWLFDVCARKQRIVNPRDIGDFSDLLEDEIEDEDFVSRCYLEILNRKADPGGLFFYTEELRSGRMSKDQLISTLMQSPERSSEKLSLIKKFFKH